MFAPNFKETRLKITSVLTRVCVKNFGRTAEELPDGQLYTMHGAVWLCAANSTVHAKQNCKNKFNTMTYAKV
jgi:hypothetical protein